MDWISSGQLQRKTGCSRRSISSAIGRLVNMGAIAVSSPNLQSLNNPHERKGKQRLFFQLQNTYFPTVENLGNTTAFSLGNFTTSASNAQSYATTATTKAAEASTARDQAVAARDQAQVYATQQFNATSSTSNSLVAGSLSFTIQAGKAFVPNQYLVITPTSDPSKFMQGLVTSYNSSTGGLVITVDFVSASGGPYAAWTFGLIGRKGDSAGRTNIMLTGNATAVAGNNYFFQSICTLTMPVSPSNGATISFSNATGNPGPAVDFGAVKVKGRTVGVVTMDGRNDAATVVYTGNSTTGWGDI